MTVMVAMASAAAFYDGDFKFQNPSATSKKSKGGRKRPSKKKKNHNTEKENAGPQKLPEQVEIEYVPEKPGFSGDEFKDVIEKFEFKDPTGSEENEEKVEAEVVEKEKKNKDPDSDEEEQKQKGISNKQKKLEHRMKLAQLKQVTSRPEVVEGWDIASSDPKLLVFLKSCRNAVPVPRHWCQKRKFLQGKRGVEKLPFQLPHFISATGIEKHRQAYNEKEDSKKLKQKQREKMQPKMGKMDIDYQVLHDAFFKYQTKPYLTKHGDLYYEGKEFEKRFREMKLGMLSQELKALLGMPDGAPPPWLVSMQRYGPPPSYPALKIPGLNAPIPLGSQFGYQPGGWGRPPVDENSCPIYGGDVFGVPQKDELNYEDEPVDKSKNWGDLVEEEEEEEDEAEEEEEEVMEEEVMEDGIHSVHSVSDVVDDVIDLRKQARKEDNRPLYQVLDEKEASIDQGSLLGTTHTYAVPVAKRVDLLKSQKTDKVDVTLAPEELEDIDDVLPAKYEQVMEVEKRRNQPEDFSDMVAENANKKKRKMQEKDSMSKKKAFKF